MTAVREHHRWLDFACVGTLIALALMTWQLFDPTVWPIMVAMSVGQVLGTASFAAFGFVVYLDYRARRLAAKGVPVTKDQPAKEGVPEAP